MKTIAVYSAVIFAVLIVLRILWWSVVRPVMLRVVEVRLSKIVDDIRILRLSELPKEDNAALTEINRMTLLAMRVLPRFNLAEFMMAKPSAGTNTVSKNYIAVIRHASPEIRDLNGRLFDMVRTSLTVNSIGIVPFVLFFGMLVKGGRMLAGFSQYMSELNQRFVQAMISESLTMDRQK